MTEPKGVGQSPQELSIKPPKESKTLPAEFWEEAAQFWRPDAEETTKHLEAGKIVILSSKFGSGKSSLYYRALKKLYEDKGFTVSQPQVVGLIQEFYSNYGKGFKFWDNRLGEANKLLLIDDETYAGDIGNESQYLWSFSGGIKGTIDDIDAEKYKIIHYVYLNADPTSSGRKKLPTKLMEQRSLQGQDDRIHFQELRQTYLPEEFIAKHLMAKGVNEELINFINDPKNKALRNPRFFAVLYGNELEKAWEYSSERGDEPLQTPFPTTIEELKNFLDVTEEEPWSDLSDRAKGFPRWITLWLRQVGGSTQDYINVLNNLGLFSRHEGAQKAADEFLKLDEQDYDKYELPEFLAYVRDSEGESVKEKVDLLRRKAYYS